MWRKSHTGTNILFWGLGCWWQEVGTQLTPNYRSSQSSGLRLEPFPFVKRSARNRQITKEIPAYFSSSFICIRIAPASYRGCTEPRPRPASGGYSPNRRATQRVPDNAAPPAAFRTRCVAITLHDPGGLTQENAPTPLDTILRRSCNFSPLQRKEIAFHSPSTMKNAFRN